MVSFLFPQVFDIAPMFGDLQPGESAVVTFSFFSQENVSREAVAECHVADGPTYQVQLRGETSEISYRLDPAHLDFGLQVPSSQQAQKRVTVLLSLLFVCC